MGIAFLSTDNLNSWKEIILKAGFVQLMGIENIGYQGQTFDPRTLDQGIKFETNKRRCYNFC